MTMQEVAFRQDQFFLPFCNTNMGYKHGLQNITCRHVVQHFSGDPPGARCHSAELHGETGAHLSPRAAAECTCGAAVKRPAQTQAGRSLAATPDPKSRDGGMGLLWVVVQN